MLRRFGLRCTSISEYNEGNFRAEGRALSGFVTPASGLLIVIVNIEPTMRFKSTHRCEAVFLFQRVGR